MKIVINTCFGGFGLSEAAFKRYVDLSDNHIFVGDIERNDKHLIQVVEEMGEEANNNYSALKIVYIPDSVDWVINDYDGIEHIAEQHRTWS